METGEAIKRDLDDVHCLYTDLQAVKPVPRQSIYVPTPAPPEPHQSSRRPLRKPVMRYRENQGVRTNGLGEVRIIAATADSIEVGGRSALE